MTKGTKQIEGEESRVLTCKAMFWHVRSCSGMLGHVLAYQAML